MRLLLLIPVIVASTNVHADIDMSHNQFRTTYEELNISNKETMGLLGTDFLFDKKMNKNWDLYSGVGIYSAVKGDRGGFFIGGLESGVKYKVANWILDTGVFIGGGGGASAPQGGGLMLRPHIGLMYDLKKFKVGINYSQVKFPNGNISSKQWGLQLDIPFQLVTSDKLTSSLNSHNLDLADVYFSLNTQTYTPKSSVKTRSGNKAKKMKLMGFSAGRYFSKNSYFFGEASGAYDDTSDGYAEFLGGVGHKYPLNDRLAIHTKAALGASGGGEVDTEGGLIYKVEAGIKFQVSPRFSLGVDYGIINAVSGDFSASLLKSSLHYDFSMATPSSKEARNNPLNAKNLDLIDWSIAMSASNYLASSSLRKNGKTAMPSVNLVNLKLNRELSPRTYLTGQAAAAYKGKSGGYATGLVGIGIKQPLTERLSLQAEVLVGAAGGGGIASGGGIVQPMAGLTYQLNKKVALQFMGGKIKAPKGGYNANVVDFGLVYKFGTIQER